MKPIVYKTPLKKTPLNEFNDALRCVGLSVITLEAELPNGIPSPITVYGKGVLAKIRNFLVTGVSVIAESVSKITLAITADTKNGTVSNSDMTVHELLKARAMLINKIKIIDFFKVKNLRMSAPIGLNSKLIDLANALKTYGKDDFPATITQLTSFDNLLAKLISNPNVISMKDISGITKDFINTGKATMKSFNKLIVKGSTTDTMAIGDMLGNMNELITNIDAVDKINDMFGMSTLTAIKSVLGSINEKLVVIIAGLGNGTITQLTTPMIKNLVTGTESAADAASRTASIHYYYVQYVATLENLKDWLLE